MVEDYTKMKKELKKLKKKKTKPKHLTYKELNLKKRLGLPSHSASKVLVSMGKEQGALVREVEEREIVRDDRSLFFNNEFKREGAVDRKWLLR